MLINLAAGLALAQPAVPPKPDSPAPAEAATNQPDTVKPAAAGPIPAAARGQPAQAAGSVLQTGSGADLMRAAMQKQRAAAQQQAKSAGAWLVPWSDEPVVPGPPFVSGASACDPIADAVAKPIIEAAAKANEIQAPLLHAVIERESGFRPCAVSPKGAQGLMQLMPETAGALGVEDPFDPQQNVDAGARYIKQLLDKYKGDLKLVLGAYNAGPAAVDAIGAVPDIPETRDYVDAIMKKIK